VVNGVVKVPGPDGVPRAGNIGPDGLYAVRDLPAGPLRIGVASPEPHDRRRTIRRDDRSRADQAAALPVAGRGRWFRLPEPLSDPTTAGVTTVVMSGVNSFPIEVH
jgi:hypothetical protein